MQYQIETAEGTEVLTQSSYTHEQFRASLQLAVRMRAVELIPNLVNQVRISEELYATDHDQKQAALASVCATAARELLDIKYGPIQGIEYRPPVFNRRWNWNNGPRKPLRG